MSDPQIILVDLSFNKIKRIEGLHGLTKLEDLSLFHNEIEFVEGLDDQLNSLKCLSLAKNSIREKDCVKYLRKFRKLGMLNIYENPVCDDRAFKFMVLAYLPKRRILDYRMVQKEDIVAARERFHNELLELEDKEHSYEKQLEVEKKIEQENKVLDVC